MTTTDPLLSLAARTADAITRARVIGAPDARLIVEALPDVAERDHVRFLHAVAQAAALQHAATVLRVTELTGIPPEKLMAAAGHDYDRFPLLFVEDDPEDGDA